ncbi:helix-turn-helix domain-containing protein [Streptomyces sp. NPDC094032]|uniref:helix-turn-helix domain-containing protein n=1 Tax=Streptomyces sp. NPDC094032 TaxID=3155308 RepID=UPI0033326EA3
MSSDHVQSVRNAWINQVRDEALRARRPEVSKAAHIGILIATYANADGSRAFPSNATLAAVAGVSEETVTRCVRLLLAVELLARRRRPNQSSVYQLLIPSARINWGEHLHIWGETRQAKARRKAKAEALAERESAEDRNPSGDASRNPSPDEVPEPVPGGAPDTSGTRPRTGADTVPGRGPEPVPGGGLPVPPTSSRDPQPDQTTADHPPQPQDARGRASEETIPQPQPQPQPEEHRRCADGCGQPVIRPDRTVCTGCERRAQNTSTGPVVPVQGAFLMVMPSSGTPDAPSAPRAPHARTDPFAPLRTCGCGRDYRAPEPGRCDDCLAAEREYTAGTA